MGFQNNLISENEFKFIELPTPVIYGQPKVHKSTLMTNLIRCGYSSQDRIFLTILEITMIYQGHCRCIR